MISSYLFAVGIRSLLYFHAVDIDLYWFEGHIIPIWTPDTGLYGYYANQILAGNDYPFISDLVPSHIIAILVNLTGISIDTLIFWLPALLSSFIVIPIIMIAHAFRLGTLGFIAALIGGISTNYYTRSYLGCMDTDMLNLVFSWSIVMFWVYTLTHRQLGYAVMGAITMLAFKIWYHSSVPVLAGMTVGLFLVVLIFYRKERIGWQAILLASIAIVPLSYLYLFSMILMLGILFIFLERHYNFGFKFYIMLLTLGFVIAASLLDISYFIQRAQDYLNKPDLISIISQNNTYYFSNVLTTVTEAKGAPIWQTNPQFSAMIFYFSPAFIGLVLMAFSYRALWVALPLVILGLLSSIAGVRFAIFAAPALALGFSYISFLLAKKMISGHILQKIFIGTLGAIAIALMLFNIQKLNPYLKPYYFLKPEVKALKSFAAQSSSDDLIISWWDFGLPLWYYTGRINTLIDNGLNKSDTFFVGNILLSSNQTFVANSAKFASSIKHKGIHEVIPYIAKYSDIYEKFASFEEVDANISSPVDAYLLLHRNMLTTLPTIAAIADRNPNNGKIMHQRQFSILSLKEPYTGQTPFIYGEDFILDLRTGVATGPNGLSMHIDGVVISEKGKLKASRRYKKNLHKFLIIYNKTKALYMDETIFNSFLIQALVLDQYDKSKFEKIADTGKMKIFKTH